MRRIVAVAACFVASGRETASAEIYRGTDPHGHEHFTTDLSRVPPQYRPRVRRTARSPAGAAPSAAARPAAGPAVAASPSPGVPPAGNADLRDGHDRRWGRSERARPGGEIQFLEQSAQVCHAPGNDPCSMVQVKFDATRDQRARFEDRARRSRLPRNWLR